MKSTSYVGIVSVAGVLLPATAHAEDVIRPFVAIVGGVKYDRPIQGENEQKEARVSAIALSRFGLRARFSGWISIESELMANGGTSLHGTSAFEGQAALQVRNQLVRLGNGPWLAEVGRVTDEASVDFFSAHVADSFLQDTATRDPLLYSGYNLGNGVRATFQVIPGLRVGLTFNAGNPVSTTSSLMVGGAFPPFDRFYSQPYQAIGKGPNHFPDDTFHMVVVTPSLLYRSPMVDAHVAYQRFVVDTDTTKKDDENIQGFNARGSLRVKLLDETVVPFANFAFTRNDTVQPGNVNKLSPDKYTGTVVGGGVDFNYQRAFDCEWGCFNGVGVQVTQVQYKVGDGIVTRLRYLNVGTTYWLDEHLAAGVRASYWKQHQEPKQSGVEDSGEYAAFATLRFVM